MDNRSPFCALPAVIYRTTNHFVKCFLGQITKIDCSNIYGIALLKQLRRVRTLDLDIYPHLGAHKRNAVQLLLQNAPSLRNVVVPPILQEPRMFAALRRCSSLKSLALPSQQYYITFSDREHKSLTPETKLSDDDLRGFVSLTALQLHTHLSADSYACLIVLGELPLQHLTLLSTNATALSVLANVRFPFLESYRILCDSMRNPPEYDCAIHRHLSRDVLLPRLKNLELHGCTREGKEDWKLPQLESIALHWGVPTVRAVAPQLRSIKIDSSTTEDITKFIRGFPLIESLTWASADEEEDGNNPNSYEFFRLLPNLKRFTVPGSDRFSIVPFVEGLRCCPQLREWKSYDIQTEPWAASWLLTNFPLEKLTLRRRYWTSLGVEELASPLILSAGCRFSSLQELEISDGELFFKSASCPQLHTLKVNDYLVSGHLPDFLTRCPRLKRLWCGGVFSGGVFDTFVKSLPLDLDEIFLAMYPHLIKSSNVICDSQGIILEGVLHIFTCMPRLSKLTLSKKYYWATVNANIPPRNPRISLSSHNIEEPPVDIAVVAGEFSCTKASEGVGSRMWEMLYDE